MDDNPYRGPEANPLGNAPPPRPKSLLSTAIKVLLALGITGLVVAMLLPAVRFSRPAAQRNVWQNKLKHIALALHDYVRDHGALPPAYTVDADGKPLHSWRTLILPYLEQGQLYKTIDLTKPWDDPANANALKANVQEYGCPSNPVSDNRTTYLAVVTPTSCLRPGESRNLVDITDGKDETLIVIEVDLKHAVPWMQPVDADESVVLGIGPDSELSHPAGVMAAFVDGHVTFLETDLTAAHRQALISIAGDDHAVLDEAGLDQD